MDTTVNTAISSIKAHERKLSVTARNIANVNTNGFERSRAVVQEGSGGGARLTVYKDRTPVPEDPLGSEAPGVARSLSNVDLADEMTALVPTTVGYKVNMQVVRARDEMIGNLLDTMV